MSGFLERAVTRGLGLERLVHRQRDSTFAEPMPEAHIGREADASSGIEEDTTANSTRRSVREQAGTRRRLRADESDASAPLREVDASSSLRRLDSLGSSRAADAADDERSSEVDGFPELRSTTAFREAFPQSVFPLTADSASRVDAAVAVESREQTYRAPIANGSAASTLRPRDSADASGYADARPGKSRGHEIYEDWEGANARSGEGSFVFEHARDGRRSASADNGCTRGSDFTSVEDDRELARSHPREHSDYAFEAHRRDRNEASLEVRSGARRMSGDANTRRVDDELTINVSIGSIDVSRPAAPAPPAGPVRPAPPRPSLDDYLQLRKKMRGR